MSGSAWNREGVSPAEPLNPDQERRVNLAEQPGLADNIPERFQDDVAQMQSVPTGLAASSSRLTMGPSFGT